MSNVTLKFVWNGEEGKIDPTSLKNLKAQNRMVVLDFLGDVMHEAQKAYCDELDILHSAAM